MVPVAVVLGVRNRRVLATDTEQAVHFLESWELLGEWVLGIVEGDIDCIDFVAQEGRHS